MNSFLTVSEDTSLDEDDDDEDDDDDSPTTRLRGKGSANTQSVNGLDSQ